MTPAAGNFHFLFVRNEDQSSDGQSDHPAFLGTGVDIHDVDKEALDDSRRVVSDCRRNRVIYCRDT